MQSRPSKVYHCIPSCNHEQLSSGRYADHSSNIAPTSVSSFLTFFFFFFFFFYQTVTPPKNKKKEQLHGPGKKSRAVPVATKLFPQPAPPPTTTFTSPQNSSAAAMDPNLHSAITAPLVTAAVRRIGAVRSFTGVQRVVLALLKMLIEVGTQETDADIGFPTRSHVSYDKKGKPFSSLVSLLLFPFFPPSLPPSLPLCSLLSALCALCALCGAPCFLTPALFRLLCNPFSKLRARNTS